MTDLIDDLTQQAARRLSLDDAEALVQAIKGGLWSTASLRIERLHRRYEAERARLQDLQMCCKNHQWVDAPGGEYRGFGTPSWRQQRCKFCGGGRIIDSSD